MHGLIYFVVPGEEKEDALVSAEDMVRDWHPTKIDYYTMPDDDHFIERWGEQKIVDADSEEGKKLIRELIKENRKVLLNHFNRAKELIEKGDLANATYHLRMASGHPYFMSAFIDASEALVDEKQIEQMRKHMAENEKIWLVPVDIHY